MTEQNFRPANTPTNSSESQVNRDFQGERGGPDPEVALNDIMPIESYEGETGHVFASEYYQMETPYEFIDSAMREDLESIDTFVKQYISENGKENNLKSYSKTLKALEKKMGIDDSTMRTAAVKKIANLVKNYNKAADAFSKNIKRKILAKLIRMSNEGMGNFDQEEYLLNQLGGII